MRTSWPRTLRAKCACRGTQCRSYSINLGRRMAAGPAGRRALFFPTSTLLYSFMFGWGMLEDGHVKQQRRQQWNQAIDQAKAELEEQKRIIEKRMPYLGPDEKQRLLDTLDGNANAVDDASFLAPLQGPEVPLCNKMILKWSQENAKNKEFLSKGAGEYPMLQDVTAGAQDSDADAQKVWEKAATHRWISEQERELWKDSTMYTMLSRNRSRFPHNTGGEMDLENVPPQSIYASEDAKRRGLKSRWTRRKIQATNLSMAKLVLRFVRDVIRKEDHGVEYSVDQKMATLRRLPVHFHQLFWSNLRDLNNKEFVITQQWYNTTWPSREMQDSIPRFPPVFHGRYPYYGQDQAGDFHRECYMMNHHIFNCFEQAFSDEISLETLLMNICDSLLTSAAPPNVTTCNALILGFTRLEQPTLVDLAIQAFDEAYMRHDEITCCAILNHYMRTDRPNHFSNFINMMTGAANVVQRRYLALAHPLLHQNLTNDELARKTHGRVVPHPTQPGKLVQKVFPTPKVFSRIIVGNLRFYGLEDTIELCTQLTQDGWAFDIVGLTYFLAATAAEGDWAAGVLVWQQIQDLRATAPTATPDARPSPSDAAAGAPENAQPGALPPLDVEIYAHMLVLCTKCSRADVASHVLADAEATSGHRAAPLKRLAQRLAKGGRDAMLMKSLRTDDHRLRADMGQRLAADWHVWREEDTGWRKRAEAETHDEVEWLKAHQEKVRREGVARWWDDEGVWERGHNHKYNHSTPPPHSPNPTATPAATSDPFSANDAAIKAWEAQAWMSTKSRRLDKHVRKAWSPQWDRDGEAGGGKK